jgi:hypothetical protein
MNAPDPIARLQAAVDPTEPGRTAALKRFNLEEFQNLSMEDLLLAQTIAGHGDTWGAWVTPESICPSRLSKSLRNYNIAQRLRHALVKNALAETSSNLTNELVEEGVLVLTRLALLMRLAPTGGQGRGRTKRLKPSSLLANIFNHWPLIIGRAIRRKAMKPDSQGLLSCLTEDDVRELGNSDYLRPELDRLYTLSTRGLWTDLPPRPGITLTTDPKGPKPETFPQNISREYQPISDRYLEEFGPRNLWLIRELGPRLVTLLEDLATHLEGLDWTKMNLYYLTSEYGAIPNFIAQHLKDHPWEDSIGRPLKPDFPLKTGARAKDKFEFPPRNWEQLRILSATLQSAHLFMALLASAARVGEVDTLPRSCVTTERDGKDYVRGWTYKLSGNLFGDARQWPAPTVLVQALGQQARLANVWIRLPPGAIDEGLPAAPPAHNALWLSLGIARTCNASERLDNLGQALQILAVRIGMDPKPDGINLHPHRLRKTIGRLAGIALFNSPLALKRLFGHKSIEMTLHYILCDKDIQTEAEAVLRELRILHCADALDEVRVALATGSPLPGHSGGAASRMVDAVKDHEARLTASGRAWADGSAYDLAYLLTSSGKGWRFIKKNIICAKVPGESGLCRKNKGEPDTSNCKPECGNRVVLALERRDVGEIVEAYMDVALQARDDEGQYAVFYYSMERLLEELDNFPDIKEKYLADPQLQSLLATYREVNQ